MIKNLDNEEIKRAESMKSDFSRIHFEMKETQDKINVLSERAKVLMEELDSARSLEYVFIIELNEKYGNGDLDPFQLTYNTHDDNK